MKLLEIYADDAGETHFREIDVALEPRDFAPPSPAVDVSADAPATGALFLVAPPGWDDSFHPTPRRQYAVLLEGRVKITATDGEAVTMEPGAIVLLNDGDSKGHLATVLDGRPARYLLVGLGDGA